MATASATYEDIERAAQGIRITRDKANPIQQFCGVWPLIKTVLQLAKNWLPKQVRDKLEQAITICDAVCASGGGGGAGGD
jgi:hypothetical protein